MDRYSVTVAFSKDGISWSTQQVVLSADSQFEAEQMAMNRFIGRYEYVEVRFSRKR